MTMVEKLVAAGVTEAANLSESEKSLLERLSPEELSALVSSHRDAPATSVNRMINSGNFFM